MSYEELLNVFFEEHNPTGRTVRCLYAQTDAGAVALARVAVKRAWLR